MNAYNLLLNHGIKPSVQRMAIMNYLMEYRIHPTVDDIYSALSFSMPTLSRTTVYNTLRLFAEGGAVQVLTIDEKNTCYDIDISEHAHFLCKKCGKIYDLPLTGERIEVTGLGQDGHTITEKHYYYKGICKYCLNK